MQDAVFLVFDVLFALVSLALVVAGVMTAVRCGKRGLGAAAAWILTIGFFLGLLSDFGSAVYFQVLVRVVRVPPQPAIGLLGSLVSLVGLIVVAVGIGMFSVEAARARLGGHHG